MKLSKNTTQLLIVGGIGVGLYLAWDNNFLGFRDLIDDLAYGAEETISSTPSSSPSRPLTNPLEELNYYKGGGSLPQQTHTGYPPNLNYPYPPVGYPQTAAPLTLPAAHYRIAGTPNIRQIPGTTTILAPPTAYMPNPTLWWEKGGIVTPNTRITLPSEINYGPYRFESPIFSRSRYPVYGTNIDYPFLVGPIGPAPCPIGEYRASDGRCYRLPSRPPEPCSRGFYRASDGRCYRF